MLFYFWADVANIIISRSWWCHWQHGKVWRITYRQCPLYPILSTGYIHHQYRWLFADRPAIRLCAEKQQSAVRPMVGACHRLLWRLYYLLCICIRKCHLVERATEHHCTTIHCSISYCRHTTVPIGHLNNFVITLFNQSTKALILQTRHLRVVQQYFQCIVVFLF